jgi:hypothetical protein
MPKGINKKPKCGSLAKDQQELSYVVKYLVPAAVTSNYLEMTLYKSSPTHHSHLHILR